ncbi:NAD-dependent epimerase/dehydratase family protein [Sphingobacterium sp. Mn56C]|uniref:NAD-dependent epimerase/dehydratase family protein n=1 Tax=Sphingobacterium sp. Mn56C TaxID=3395261 RepID=UPI003BD989CE
MILVTGGTGFLGSTLIKLLVEQGKAVRAIKRSDAITPEYLKASSLIEWVNADVTDYFSLDDCFHGIKQVYHCAAMISYQKADAPQMFNINIEGTKNIVNLCLAYQARLVHVSSIAALGSSKDNQPVDERDKWEYDAKTPNYSLSKYKSELEVWRGINEGLEAVIVNPSVIMGVGAGKQGSRVIFDLVNRGLKIYPPGSVGIVDVHDVAQVMIQLMQRDGSLGQRYIVNSENISNKDLLERIAQLLGKQPPTVAAKPFMLEVAWRIAQVIAFLQRKKAALTEESARASAIKLAYKNQKIIEALNYTFKPVDTTLKEIAAAYYK